MLNNVNSRGVTKSKKVEVMNFPGTASTDIVEKIDILENQPKFLIVHVGTNNLINDVNLLKGYKSTLHIYIYIYSFFCIFC